MSQQKSSLAIRCKGQDSLSREVDIMGKPSGEIISTKLIVRIITKLRQVFRPGAQGLPMLSRIVPVNDDYESPFMFNGKIFKASIDIQM